MTVHDHALATPAPQRSDAVLPRHIGVIMDGNGRWARARGKPRTEGHRAGVERLQELVRMTGERGIPYLTAFSFSSENWRRPQEEISFLFNLMRRFVASDLERLVKNRVKVTVLGERDGLEPAICRLIDEVEERTKDGDRLRLNLAFNYGSQLELVRAAREIAEAAVAGRLAPADITVHTLSDHLYTAGMPDPDLIVRTAGEKRLSNFLLWQAAYAEFVFVDETWPEFDETVFERVLAEYGRRQRRFGGLGPEE